MMIVTGAAGFIGSCVVSKLNERGIKDLILVDHYDDDADPKKKNLEGKEYSKYFDKKDFLKLIQEDAIKDSITAVIHMGACSSTTCQDAPYFEENNFEYTRALARWALKRNARFIYASSAATYGDGGSGYRDDFPTMLSCKPLNLYGQSKQKFDLWAFENSLLDKIVGLKFFNVFGPNEYHKGDMRSVAAKNYQRIAQEGKISLFKSYRKDYADGEQKRDFVYVKDAVQVVLFFLDNPKVNGIFNIGTGRARSWNDLARAMFSAVGKEPAIDYIDMPDVLKDKYQYFTEANMNKLRAGGYTQAFMSLEDSIKDYAKYLKTQKYL